MLSNKVIDYLNKQGVYSEKEDKAYKKALIDLGIDLNSDFALFNLNSRPLKSTHLRDIARKQCPADFFNK